MQEKDGVALLTPSDLMLNYTQFEELIQKSYDKLDSNSKEWLAEWNKLDLALSPMDDHERKMMRYGHYLGWRDANQSLSDA